MENIKLSNRLLEFIDLSKLKDLFSLGLKFFIIQIAGILLYETNNIIISQLFGPAEVTPYNIVFKYFNLIFMVFSIIITPFWSAFTEAWVKKEFDWIKAIVRKLCKIWGLLLAGGIFMLIISPFVYKIWIKGIVIIPVSMSVLVFLWVIIYIWTGIYTNFLNGVGKIKLQLYLSISAAVINIPLAILLGKNLGISGVLLANILVLLFAAVAAPVQYNKIIRMDAKGIWNK